MKHLMLIKKGQSNIDVKYTPNMNNFKWKGLRPKNDVRINVHQIQRIKDRLLYFLWFGDINFLESFIDKDIKYFY